MPFDYGEQRIRTVVDLDGEPWFVAADVCAVLGLEQVSRAMTRLDEDQHTSTQITGPNGRTVTVNIVSEPGLYDLIIRSDKPEARPFRRWVTSEVLPSIRRTGSYGVARQLPQTYAEALRAYADEVEARELADAKVAELEPAAEQYHRWQTSPDTVYVVEWAKTIGLTQAEAFKALRECEVLFRQQHEGAAFNVPKRAYERYFVLVDEYLPGPARWTKVPKITAEGQIVLAELLLDHGWIAP